VGGTTLRAACVWRVTSPRGVGRVPREVSERASRAAGHPGGCDGGERGGCGPGDAGRSAGLWGRLAGWAGGACRCSWRSRSPERAGGASTPRRVGPCVAKAGVLGERGAGGPCSASRSKARATRRGAGAESRAEVRTRSSSSRLSWGSAAPNVSERWSGRPRAWCSVRGAVSARRVVGGEREAPADPSIGAARVGGRVGLSRFDVAPRVRFGRSAGCRGSRRSTVVARAVQCAARPVPWWAWSEGARRWPRPSPC
jgi:hypothetical protein